jgi:sugar fermentation stimulation protein A
MATCWEPGAPVQLSHSADPRRRLAWTLERVDMGRGWIGVNTQRPNQVLAEGIALGRIPGLRGLADLRREVAYRPAGLAPGRIDFALGGATAHAGRDGPEVLVEVKNVTLLDGDCLRFPDAVSARASRHLDLLAAAVGEGRRGVILFAANRPEGERVGPAWSIDPAYARRLVEAVGQGVEAMAVRLVHHARTIEVGAPLAIDLEPPPGSLARSPQ